jgi:hypothetical protein
MSVHGATQMKCAICDEQVSLEIARQEWWICTICSSYVCPRCYSLFRESPQDTCPGTISRAIEAHTPHFTRFLGRRRINNQSQTEQRTSVVILGDVPRNQRPPRPRRGKVIILEEESGEPGTTSPQGDEDAN